MDTYNMCYVDTKKISDKSTYQIVTIKGSCSGFGSVIVPVVTGDLVFSFKYVQLIRIQSYIRIYIIILLMIKSMDIIIALMN